jgi:TPP-dependent pyruvate/acetoin dehydrogenase alpha subunit
VPGGVSSAVVGTEVALEMHRLMVLSRVLEDRLLALYRQGSIRGRLLTGRGQEAIPAGAALAVRPEDVMCLLHRDMAAHLARGTTAETVLLHHFGKATGPSRGRDGDIHFAEWSRNNFPMVSHLPDSLPVATGIGLASRLRDEGIVVVAFCGEGATSTGAWHESVNFAAVFQVPTVFVIENNQYAYSTPVERQYRAKALVERGPGYGLPAVSVDGNDALAVHAVVGEAVDRARQGGGPTLIEALTMRMDGHAVHDDAPYVPGPLLEEWRRRDPIDRLGGELRGRGVDEMRLQADWRAARAEVETAVERAWSAPDPTGEDVAEGVYAEEITRLPPA